MVAVAACRAAWAEWTCDEPQLLTKSPASCGAFFMNVGLRRPSPTYDELPISTRLCEVKNASDAARDNPYSRAVPRRIHLGSP